jgi:addiction module HigA family antidote|tara:strand:- start:477 stop:791 length:315 start_codon:yes stop_codon:yes gene_type:complete
MAANPIHPGEVLKEEFLVELGLSGRSFAEHIGVPANRVTEIVRGTRGITGETALLFSKALGTTPEFWINLQGLYELDVARAALSEKRSSLRTRLTQVRRVHSQA